MDKILETVCEGLLADCVVYRWNVTEGCDGQDMDKYELKLQVAREGSLTSAAPVIWYGQTFAVIRSIV